MLNSIRKMIDELNTNDILYCHWKSNEHLEDAMNGDTDLDILVQPYQRDRLEMILSKCGLKRFRATPLMQYNAIEDYIGFDESTAKIWHLHLHYRLSLGEKHLKGYTLPWNDFIFERRIYDEKYSIYCTNFNDEYMLLILRIALKLRWRDMFRSLGKDDVVEIEWLSNRINKNEVLNNVGTLLGYECKNEYEKILKNNKLKKMDFISLQKKLRVRMKVFHTYNIFTSWIVRSIREMFWITGGVSRRLGLNKTSASRRISPSGGCVVAFLGCDGAGKSTTLRYVKEEFGKKIDVCEFYMGSGDGKSSLIRLPMKLIAKKVGGKGIGEQLNKEDTKLGFTKRIKKNLYKISKTIWAITLAFEKNKKLKMINKARNKGLIVLTDRYPQVETMGYNDGPLLSRWKDSKNLVLKVISIWEYNVYKKSYYNPPELLIKLMVSPNIAIERKPEMTKEQIEAKIDTVKKMKFAKRTVQVSTEVDKTVSFSEVMKEIWKEI